MLVLARNSTKGHFLAIDVTKLREIATQRNRYQAQLNRLMKLGKQTSCIEAAVSSAGETLQAGTNSFVIYGDVTRINALINQLISRDGIYIGVTATPARLDLNNTFDNDNEKWVNFPPHEAYTGQDIFFPLETSAEFSLQTLPDTDDSPKYLREAIFRFLVRVDATQFIHFPREWLLVSSSILLRPSLDQFVYSIR